MWWTMVIGGKISRSGRRRILPKTLGGKTFSKCPHLSPGHTDVLKKQNVGRKYRGGERRGVWQK